MIHCMVNRRLSVDEKQNGAAAGIQDTQQVAAPFLDASDESVTESRISARKLRNLNGNQTELGRSRRHYGRVCSSDSIRKHTRFEVKHCAFCSDFPVGGKKKKKNKIAWISLDGRLLNAEEATAAAKVFVGLKDENAFAWDSFAPLQRVLIVAISAAAAAQGRQKSSGEIKRLQREVENRDHVLQLMKDELISIYERLESEARLKLEVNMQNGQKASSGMGAFEVHNIQDKASSPASGVHQISISHRPSLCDSYSSMGLEDIVHFEDFNRPSDAVLGKRSFVDEDSPLNVHSASLIGMDIKGKGVMEYADSKDCNTEEEFSSDDCLRLFSHRQSSSGQYEVLANLEAGTPALEGRLPIQAASRNGLLPWHHFDDLHLSSVSNWALSESASRGHRELGSNIASAIAASVRKAVDAVTASLDGRIDLSDNTEVLAEELLEELEKAAAQVAEMEFEINDLKGCLKASEIKMQWMEKKLTEATGCNLQSQAKEISQLHERRLVTTLNEEMAVVYAAKEASEKRLELLEDINRRKDITIVGLKQEIMALENKVANLNFDVDLQGYRTSPLLISPQAHISCRFEHSNFDYDDFHSLAVGDNQRESIGSSIQSNFSEMFHHSYDGLQSSLMKENKYSKTFPLNFQGSNADDNTEGVLSSIVPNTPLSCRRSGKESSEQPFNNASKENSIKRRRWL